MKNAITRADETRDEEYDVDLPRGAESDEPAAIGDSITLLTYWGRVKATLLEIADPPREGMTLQFDISNLLARLRSSSDPEPESRKVAVMLRLRNLDDGPFDRHRAVLPDMQIHAVTSDGTRVSGTEIGPASQYGSIELPEPGHPTSTGWVGFQFHPGREPQAFILEGVGQQSGLWRLDRKRANLTTHEHLSRDVLVEKLKQGFDRWNPWRKTRPRLEINLAHADLTGMDLSRIDFSGANLVRAQLSRANLDGAQFIGAHLRHAGLQECEQFTQCDFSNADLRHASFARAFVSHARFQRALLNNAHFVDSRFYSTDLAGAVLESSTAFHSQFWSCNLQDVRFDGSDFTEALLFESEFPRSSWKRVKLVGATLRHSNLKASTFLDSELFSADLSGADLSDSTITRCDLSEVSLVGTNLEGSTLSESRVYGVSAWGIKGTPASQGNLITTRRDEADLVVDDLELAQFIYLLLNREKLRNVIDATTKKGVLILGRFGDGGLDLLRAIADWLRQAGYLPMLFDFGRPAGMTYTDTIRTIIGLARFVIVDLSGPSVPHEFMATAPFHHIPFVPILEEGRKDWSTFKDFLLNQSVLAPVPFSSKDHLLSILPTEIVGPAEERVAEWQVKLDKIYERDG